MSLVVLLGLNKEESRGRLEPPPPLNSQISHSQQKDKMMSNGTLLTHLYVQLSKTNDGSNKFYNIHVAPCPKGELFRGSLKRSTQTGFEVYSIFGKIEGTPRQRHVGFFFSEEAAIRSAERLKESKKQKGYTDTGKVYSSKTQHNLIQKDSKPIFDPVPQAKVKMTKTQKGRFSDLID